MTENDWLLVAFVTVTLVAWLCGYALGRLHGEGGTHD